MKHHTVPERFPALARVVVAFTPKGGCPLKPAGWVLVALRYTRPGSIHPQGWVPVETSYTARAKTGSGS